MDLDDGGNNPRLLQCKRRDGSRQDCRFWARVCWGRAAGPRSAKKTLRGQRQPLEAEKISEKKGPGGQSNPPRSPEKGPKRLKKGPHKPKKGPGAPQEGPKNPQENPKRPQQAWETARARPEPRFWPKTIGFYRFFGPLAEPRGAPRRAEMGPTAGAGGSTRALPWILQLKDWKILTFRICGI